MQILAYLIASLIPLLSLYLIYKLDLYKTGEFTTILICGIAGVVAFEAAGFVNGTIIRQGWLARMDVIRYAAPVIEEILKGLLLWYLVRRPKFTYFVEGAVYGFAAGIGFAIFENFQYIHRLARCRFWNSHQPCDFNQLDPRHHLRLAGNCPGTGAL